MMVTALVSADSGSDDVCGAAVAFGAQKGISDFIMMGPKSFISSFFSFFFGASKTFKTKTGLSYHMKH